MSQKILVQFGQISNNKKKTVKIADPQGPQPNQIFMIVLSLVTKMRGFTVALNVTL